LQLIACNILQVTADAHFDHPSSGMVIIGRLLASHGIRIRVIAQP
jgi:radical SAM superfamily enzyme YgiQ (UPF0313 family)